MDQHPVGAFLFRPAHPLFSFRVVSFWQNNMDHYAKSYCYLCDHFTVFSVYVSVMMATLTGQPPGQQESQPKGGNQIDDVQQQCVHEYCHPDG
jgi:hypothetical protein